LVCYYYSASAKTYTITFNKNGATSQTNSSGTAVTDASVTRSCTIDATYNGGVQATTCKVTSPTIVGSTNTPTVVGYNESSSGTTSSWNQTTEKPISADATYYAITTSPAITHTVTYTKQGTGVTAIGATTNSCTIAATYNGTAQASSCNVTLPTITVSAGYTAVGWNTSSTATTGTAVSTSVALSANTTYYSISYKDSLTYTAHFNANNATLSDTSDKSCVIAKAYNSDTQATSCTVTAPTITAPSATPTVVGFNTTSSATTSTLANSGTLTLTSTNNDSTWYAITKKDALTYSVTYAKGSNVSAIGKTSDSCTIAATYNGSNQVTSCNVTTPSITANTGYTSVGFALTSGATTGVSAGSALTLTSTNDGKTYYGNASANDYTISYYSSGSSIGTTAAKYGTAVSLTKASTLGATKTGYTFKGWDTSSAATTIVYTDNQSVTSLVPSGTINLYAVYVDDIAPVCTWSSASPTTTGNTTTLTLSCTDLGVGIPSTALTTSNFTTSNVTYGSVTNISAPTAITNGYSYVVTVTGNAVGAFKVSLNANAIADNNSNNNALTTSSDITVNGRTYTATFIKNGTGVTAIGSTSLSCTTTGSNTTCSVSAPAISVSAGYTAVGWNTTSDDTTGLAELTMSANTTYYSISYKDAITLTAKWNANGNTLSSTTDSSCILDKVYNSNTQATSCVVTAPTITAPSATPTIIGFNTSSSATTNNSSYNTSTKDLTLTSSNSGSTWYAITSASAKTYTAHWDANGATLSSTSDTSCTINATYNGTSQATSCNVTAPTITAPIIIGFNTNSTATTSILASGATLSLTASNNDNTYYAITAKIATTGSCASLTYNGASQTLAGGGTGVTYSNNSQTSAGTYTVTIDVSSGYLFSDKTSSKTLSCSIAKKAVTYTAGSSSKVYDGTPLTYNGATLSSGSLVSGHTASFSITGSITNAGSTTNTLSSVTITDASSNDVTANYDITKNNGTLTISKATPTLTLSATSGTVYTQQTITFTETGSIAGSFTNSIASTSVASVSPTSYSSIAANTAKTVTITGKGNATSTITVTFTPTDTTNYYSTTATYSVTSIDNIAPTCSSSSGGSTSWTTGSRTITQYCSDSGSGCASSSYSSSFSNTKYGYITIYDNAGNSTSCTENVYSDTVAPTCGSTSGESTTWTSSSRTVSQNCSDSLSGCASSSYSSTFSNTKYGYISIYDNAGNSRSCTEYAYSDTVAPTCGSTSGGSTTWTNSSRTITQSCSDTLSGCASSSYSKTFSNVQTSSITIYDNANNSRSCPVNVYSDTGAPTLSLTAGTASNCNGYSGRNYWGLTVANASDSLSGVSTYHFHWDCSGISISTGILDSGAYCDADQSSNPTLPTWLCGTGANITGSVCDKAGNCTSGSR
jgi:uncharacterized repeat protein (TIGR02543 family)